MIRQQEKQVIDFADFIKEVVPYTKFPKTYYEEWAINAISEGREAYEAHVKNITYEISISSIAAYFGEEKEGVTPFSDFGEFEKETEEKAEVKTEPTKKSGTDRKAGKVS